MTTTHLLQLRPTKLETMMRRGAGNQQQQNITNKCTER